MTATTSGSDGPDAGGRPTGPIPLPELTEANRHFWTGGGAGELRLLRCDACRYWVHPPSPVCPRCRQRALQAQAVSGDATVYSFTVNHQPWFPNWAPPYVIAVVELPEQADLRLTTNLVGCRPETVRIGMHVHAEFEQHDDVWLPLFRPWSA